MIPPSYSDIDRLVQAYTPNLLRAAFSWGFNEIEAEELVQDTFVAYLEGQTRFKGKSKILTYLFGILYNKARTARRSQAREEATDEIETIFDSCFDSGGDWDEENLRRLSEPERHTHVEVLGEKLRDCLNRLSLPLRMAFSLKEVDGLESSRICHILNISKTNLGVCLFRARNQLRTCLTAQDVSIL